MKLTTLGILINTLPVVYRIYLEANFASKGSNYLFKSSYRLKLDSMMQGSYSQSV